MTMRPRQWASMWRYGDGGDVTLQARQIVHTIRTIGLSDQREKNNIIHDKKPVNHQQRVIDQYDHYPSQ